MKKIVEWTEGIVEMVGRDGLGIKMDGVWFNSDVRLSVTKGDRIRIGYNKIITNEDKIRYEVAELQQIQEKKQATLKNSGEGHAPTTTPRVGNMPADGYEHRQRLICRQACLNTAVSLLELSGGAGSVDALKAEACRIAKELEEFVYEK